MNSMSKHQRRVKLGLRALLFAVFSLIAAACTGGESASPPAETPTTSSSTTAAPDEEPLDPADADEIAEEVEVDEVPEEPSAPVGLVVTANAAGSVTLGWDESRDESVTGYEVTRVGSIGTTEMFATTEPTFTDGDLTDGDVFTYTVTAINDAGASERSEALPVQVGVDANPPTRPGTPTTVESTEGVSITWRTSTDFSGIDRYIVTRILNGETTEIDTVDPMLFDDVAVGQTLSYAVRAVDGSGNESENSRFVTILSGTASDGVIVVVSTHADPAADPNTARLQEALLNAGYVVTWFEDDVFDSNITTSDDVVLLLGDVEGQGFDWNLFGTDAHTIALKGIFFEASGFLDAPPRTRRLGQIAYNPPGEDQRFLQLALVDRPRPSPIIPLLQQLPDLEVWGTPAETAEEAIAGLLRPGGELANEREAPACRAFFPGNADALAQQTQAGWDLLIEFVDTISDTCR